MSAPLKIIGGLVGLIIVLLLATVILVPLFVDPNDHKDTIVAEVKKATGRDLAINGDISLSLFPWLGLELGELQLSNAAGFGDKPFVSFDRTQVRVKLLPLFSKEVVIDTVAVDGLRLNLAKNAAGISNWDDLTQRGESTETTDDKQAEAPPAAEQESEGVAGLNALAIQGVEINDAYLVWDDKASGQHYEIKGVNLETGAISPGQPTDLTLSLSIVSDQPALTADLRLKGQIIADIDAKKHQINGFTLHADLQGEMLPKEGVQAELVATLALDQAADVLNIKSLILVVADDLRLTGNLSGRALSTAPVFEGELKLAEFSPRSVMKQFAVPVPETADPEVLKKLAMQTNFRADTKNFALEKLALNLDQSNISGHFKLLNFSQPAYRFQMKLDEIDVDRYLPPPAEEAQPQSGDATATAVEETDLIPVETIRPLDIEGKFGIDKFKAKGIQAQFIELDIQAKDGRLAIGQSVKRFYDGTINGRITLDVSGKLPRISIEEHAQKIQVESLIKDVADQDRLSGFGSFNAKLTTTGQRVDQFKQQLAGTFDFAFKNGAVKGINVAKMLREAKAKMAGKKLSPDKNEEKTDFSELTASATIDQGLLRSNDLLMMTPFLRITGKGKVNLVAENLDYLIRPVIVSSDKGQGGEGLDDLVGVPIPIQLTGPWSKPDWKINFEEVLLNSQKAKVEKELKAQKAKVEKKLKKGLEKELEKVVPKELDVDPGKLLKKLF